MKQTHTPAPWKAWSTEEITGRPRMRAIVVKHLRGGGWDNVCRLPDVPALSPARAAEVSAINSRQDLADELSGDTEQDANARLIASAPNLLAALEPIGRVASNEARAARDQDS